MSLERGMSLNDQISREAAEWLVEFRTGEIDPGGRRDFDSWLRASPEHVRAFIEMAAIWHEGSAIDSGRLIDIDAIVRRAQTGRNVASLPPAREGMSTSSEVSGAASPDKMTSGARGKARSRRARAWAWAVAASLLTAVIAAALILHAGLGGARTYATGVRVRRSIALSDGSKVLLDSKSRLRVSFTPATRTVELLRGQALFHVVSDPQRPFLVRAGHAVVRDVGTVFDLNRMGDGAIVTVVEGRVAVAVPREPQDGNDMPGSRVRVRGATQSIYLSAGEQLDAQVGHFSPKPIHVDVRSETAWTRGNVVLESATLAEIAHVFNRYSTRTLVAKDLGRRPLRLSGVFSTDPRFIVDYLRSRPDIAVTETHSEITIIRNPVH